MIRYIITSIIITIMIIMFFYRRYVNAQLDFIVPIIKKSKNILYEGELNRLTRKLEQMGFAINKDNDYDILIVNDSTYNVFNIPHFVKNVLVVGENTTIRSVYKPTKMSNSYFVPKVTYYKIKN